MTKTEITFKFYLFIH